MHNTEKTPSFSQEVLMTLNDEGMISITNITQINIPVKKAAPLRENILKLKPVKSREFISIGSNQGSKLPTVNINGKGLV